MKILSPRLAIILLLTLLKPLPSYAHPHSWIDMKTEIVGEKNNIIGFNMQWTFDAMSSAYMLDGSDLSPEHKAASLQAVADSVLKNMLTEHYFTYFYDKETPIRYKIAQKGKLTQNGPKATLFFYLPLSKPQPAVGNTLRLLVFEPSYYVDMSWEKRSSITLSPSLQKHCQIILLKPNPTTQQMNYALTLPIDADPDNALGQLFTQTAKLNCLN